MLERRRPGACGVAAAVSALVRMPPQATYPLASHCPHCCLHSCLPACRPQLCAEAEMGRRRGVQVSVSAGCSPALCPCLASACRWASHLSAPAPLGSLLTTSRVRAHPLPPPACPAGTRRGGSPRRRSGSSMTRSATTSTSDSWSVTCASWRPLAPCPPATRAGRASGARPAGWLLAACELAGWG